MVGEDGKVVKAGSRILQMQKLAKERKNHGRIIELNRLVPVYSGPTWAADTHHVTDVKIDYCKIEILPQKEELELRDVPEAEMGDDEPSEEISFEHGLKEGDYVKLHFLNGLVCQWKKMASYDVKTLHYEMKMEEKKQAVSLTESPAQEARRLGNEAFKKGDFERASALYSRAINIGDKGDKQGMSTLYSNRAMSLLKLGHHSQAVNDCNEAIRLDPRNVKAFMRRASGLQSLPNPDTSQIQEIAVCFENVLAIEPYNKHAAVELSRAKALLEA